MLVLVLLLFVVMHVLHVELDLSFHQNEDFPSKTAVFSSWKKQFPHLFFCCDDTFERKKKK